VYDQKTWVADMGTEFYAETNNLKLKNFFGLVSQSIKQKGKS